MLRCDSPETASLLLAQLNRLIEKPDNQKKFQEIENRLQVKKTEKIGFRWTESISVKGKQNKKSTTIISIKIKGYANQKKYVSLHILIEQI